MAATYCYLIKRVNKKENAIKINYLPSNAVLCQGQRPYIIFMK